MSRDYVIVGMLHNVFWVLGQNVNVDMDIRDSLEPIFKHIPPQENIGQSHASIENFEN